MHDFTHFAIVIQQVDKWQILASQATFTMEWPDGGWKSLTLWCHLAMIHTKSVSDRSYHS